MASDKKDEKTVYAVKVKMSDYVTPQMVDDNRRKFVTWGANNDFWKELNDLFYNSPSNGAAINGIVRLAYGDGLENENGSAPEQILNRISVKDIKRLMLQFVKTNKIVLQVDYNVGQGERTIKGVHYLHGASVALGKRDDRNDIRTIYFSNGDWGRKDKITPYPAFGFGDDTDATEIFFYQKAYDTRAFYGPVDYQGGIPYACLEIETANYHINHSHNGFTASAIINLNNGIPESKTMRDDIISDIVETRTGSSNAGKVVVLFNRDSTNAATVESFDIPDAHKQYEFVSKESTEKIFVAHNITSPLLLGVRDTGGGLGSNASEIKESYNLFNLMTLEPKRQEVIEALTEIFEEDMNGVDFKQFDFFTEEVEEEPETNTQMKALPKKMTMEDESEWTSFLETAGEVEDDDEWGLISETQAGTEEEEIAEEERMITQFAKNPKSPSPQAPSKKGDTGLYKIRYAYEGETSAKSRDFCVFMDGERKKGKVYRREEITTMSKSGVNGEFAPQGKSTYSIWAYKGGSYCGHAWFRRVYFRKRNAKGAFLPKSKTPGLENDKQVTIDSAKKAGVPASKITPPGLKKAETRPIDMPNRGSLKNK